MSLNRLRRRAEDRRARRSARVAERLATIGSDPVVLSKRVQELELILQGAYAIVHNLVRDHPELRGITIPYEKLKAIPPTEHVRTERNKRGDVTLVYEVDPDEKEPREQAEAAGTSGLDAPVADEAGTPEESNEAGREARRPRTRGRSRTT